MNFTDVYLNSALSNMSTKNVPPPVIYPKCCRRIGDDTIRRTGYTYKLRGSDIQEDGSLPVFCPTRVKQPLDKPPLDENDGIKRVVYPWFYVGHEDVPPPVRYGTQKTPDNSIEELDLYGGLQFAD